MSRVWQTASTASDQEHGSRRAQGTRNPPAQPPLQRGWLWRDEGNSRAEQQWTETYLRGWISSICKLLNCIKVILFNPMALLLLTGLSQVLLHRWRNDETKSTHSAPCLLGVTSLPLLILRTQTYYSPGYLITVTQECFTSISLFLSPQFPEKSRSQPLAVTAVELSKPSLGAVAVLQSSHQHGQEQRQAGREGKAPGPCSEHKFFLLLWEQRAASIYSCSIQVSQNLSCRKPAWEGTGVAWFS